MKFEFDVLKTAKEAILEEAESVRKFSDLLDDSFLEAVKLILKNKRKLIISGTGKSGIIGQKIAATLTSTGTPAFFLSPTEALHGDLGYVGNGDLLILISKSGESDELNQIMPYFKSNNNSIIAIVGDKSSTLALNSDVTLWIGSFKEICPNNLAPTTSTTITTVLGDVIAYIIMKIRNFTDEDFAKYHPGGQLGKKLLLKVKDLMHKDEQIPQVNAGSSIKDAIFEISAKRLGFTLVMDNNDVSGILTDGDLRRLFGDEIDIAVTRVSDVMTLNPKSINENKLAVNALAKMEEFKITSLIVYDDNNVLSGVIHIHDILKIGLKSSN